MCRFANVHVHLQVQVAKEARLKDIFNNVLSACMSAVSVFFQHLCNFYRFDPLIARKALCQYFLNIQMAFTFLSLTTFPFSYLINGVIIRSPFCFCNSLIKIIFIKCFKRIFIPMHATSLVLIMCHFPSRRFS